MRVHGCRRRRCRRLDASVELGARPEAAGPVPRQGAPRASAPKAGASRQDCQGAHRRIASKTAPKPLALKPCGISDKGYGQPMALKPCRECKVEISTSAKVCPHCGRKDPHIGPGSYVLGTVALLVIIVIVGAAIGLFDQETPEEAAERAVKEAEEAAEKAAKEAEEKKYGLHCLSRWDGSHVEFKALVKRHMNDPDSFEHVETKVSSVNASGRHVIIMQFRGRNAFGGMVKNTAKGSYLPDCSSLRLIEVL